MTENTLKWSRKAGYDSNDPTPQRGQNVGVLPEQHPFLVLIYDVIGDFHAPALADIG